MPHDYDQEVDILFGTRTVSQLVNFWNLEDAIVYY